LDDAISAYRWLLAEGAAPAQLAVMGDSAGGGLALATLLRLRDEGLALPAAAVGISPWTDLALTGESVHINAKMDPILDVEQTAVFARRYLAGTDPRNPYASPLYGDPRGLPPILIQVGSDEILRDDAVRMAAKLRAAGCSVELEVWPRMPHAWHLFARILPEGKRALERIGAFVQRQMERPSSDRQRATTTEAAT
jgi:acetyl esterase/lipase